MNTNPAGYPSPGRLSLRQTAARAGLASRDALLFPSARRLIVRAVEAGTADHAHSSCLGACPGLTIHIRSGVFTSAGCEMAAGNRVERGATRRSLPPILIRRASRRFPARAGRLYLSASPTLQARHHSRRNRTQLFPSHLGNSSFAANQRSEGEFSDGQKDFAGKANG